MELSTDELVLLVKRVFKPRSEDLGLAILIDFPDSEVADDPAWLDRRSMALDWHRKLLPSTSQLGLDRIELFGYRNVRANNADLPSQVSRITTLPPSADELPEPQPFDEIFSQFQLFLVPTRFSATAPMKMKAREFGFRAATMPGFSRAMIPALALDYEKIHQRVELLKGLVDKASACELLFQVGDSDHHLTLDLRFRQGHASGGLITVPGTAGNLPSGEAYIVPYEGENEPSLSRGVLPVQFGEDVVLYKIEENRAVAVLSENPASQEERRKLEEEPAYGNLAELGLGVLGDMGVEPCGVVLMDEKLGLHIAFGRSEHFGGQVGPSDFSRPERVVHIDRVYLPQLQPKVKVRYVNLQMPEGPFRLMEDGAYRIDWKTGTHGQ
jgi:hypothetical protein